MSIQGMGLGDNERLVVSPKRAAFMLDCGITTLYELMNNGELQSFRDGGSRKVVVASIRKYVADRLPQAS